MPTPHAPPEQGFTYLGLIILVAVIGMTGAAALKVGSLLQRAAAEEELLAIGAAFSDALRSYAAATPRGQPQQPQTLQDLLKDPRFPNTRRHLRKIFVDPITGKAEWGVVYLGDKVGVLGVYSLSQAAPLKVANFDPRFLNMENKQHLSEWKFTMSSQTMPNAPVQQPLTPMVGAALPSLFPAAAPAGETPAAPDAPEATVPPPDERKQEAERLALEKADAARAEAERLEAERLEAERLEAEKADAEKAQAEQAEADKEAAAQPEPTR